MKKTIIRISLCIGISGLLLAGFLSGQQPPNTQIQYDLRFGGLDVPEEQIFDVPIDLAVGPEGRIYILDSRDNNIKVFTGDGKYISTLSREGSGPGELNRPWTLAFVNGRLHVVDTNNGRVQVFSSEGTIQRSYKVAADFGVGMAFGPEGLLYVNTRGFRSPKLIQVYDTQGQRVQEFGEVEGEPLEFFDFTAIKKDIKDGRIPAVFKNEVQPVPGVEGTIWAVYRSLPRLVQYSRKGELQATLNLDIEEYDSIYAHFRQENEKIENEPHRFYPLRYVNDAVSDSQGNLFLLLNVADRMTVLVFGRDGSLIKTVRGPEDRVSRIDFDREGRLYALGSESHYIYRFKLD
jgi:WD40 repeat protein